MTKLPLKTHRLIAGYTIKRVSEETGISESAIRTWERDTDKLNSASFKYIVALSELYGIRLEEIET